MTLFDNELILNHITYGEFVPPFKKDFEDYKQMAHLYLNHKDRHLFEDEILSQYGPEVTMEKLIAQNPERFIQGANREKNGTRQKTWYDIWGMEEIKREDDFFDYFFSCKLRHLSLLDIDAFLAFHLEESFRQNRPEFSRFLQLIQRQYPDKFTPHITETIREWIAAAEANAGPGSLAGHDKEDKVKGRMPREAGDRKTCLTLNQTALLIEYMQQAGILLKGSDLTFTQAGKAFHLLTGYSADSIRLQLGAKGSVEYAVKKEDYRELYAAVQQLAALIQPKTISRFRDQKPPGSHS